MIENETPIAVTHQGAVLIENATVYRRGETVVAISLNMETRHGTVCGSGNDENGFPQIGIIPNKSSKPLHKDLPKDAITEVTFLGYAGWTVWSADVDKSSVLICLVKDNK